MDSSRYFCWTQQTSWVACRQATIGFRSTRRTSACRLYTKHKTNITLMKIQLVSFTSSIPYQQIRRAANLASLFTFPVKLVQRKTSSPFLQTEASTCYSSSQTTNGTVLCGQDVSLDLILYRMCWPISKNSGSPFTLLMSERTMRWGLLSAAVHLHWKLIG